MPEPRADTSGCSRDSVNLTPSALRRPSCFTRDSGPPLIPVMTALTGTWGPKESNLPSLSSKPPLSKRFSSSRLEGPFRPDNLVHLDLRTLAAGLRERRRPRAASVGMQAQIRPEETSAALSTVNTGCKGSKDGEDHTPRN